MKFVKKNQVIIYVVALMLVVAGYLNFTSTNDLSTAVQISSSEEELAKAGNIGDAQLVSGDVTDVDDFFDEKDISEEVSTTNNNITTNNTTNELEQSDIKNSGNNTVTTNSNTKNTKDNSDYFTTSKLERDTMYSQMLASYENILNSNNSLETQRQSATEEISKINNVKNSIMICENLIKTKGFNEVIVFVNGNSVSVIVDDDQLGAEKVAQIQNIVSRELNTKVEDIHISSK